MAQIVMIDTGTLRPGVNEIGDKVSVYDDDVHLGPAYSGFKVLKVPGTKAEVEALLHSKIPETRVVHKAKAPAGEWPFDEPERKEVWNDNGTWREVVKAPKYPVNVEVTTGLENIIADKALTDASKLSFLATATRANVARIEENKIELPVVQVQEAIKA